MGLPSWLTRLKRRRRAARAERDRTPSFREMHARLRTERAENRLLETEARIRGEAARVRRPR